MNPLHWTWQLHPNTSSLLCLLEWHHTTSCGIKKGQQQHGQTVVGQRGQNWCKDQGETEWSSCGSMICLEFNWCNVDVCYLFPLQDGLTPLHCGARSGHEQVVEILLDRGAPFLSKTKVATGTINSGDATLLRIVTEQIIKHMSHIYLIGCCQVDHISFETGHIWLMTQKHKCRN